MLIVYVGVVRPVLDMLLLSFVYCLYLINPFLYPLRLYFDSCYDIFCK
jgi:hypothetical protein